MNPLGQRIAALIAAHGPISVAEFMTMALHDPQAGYYTTRDPLGASGDFITAPEISQIFGELLGLWYLQVWHDQGRPTHKLLVEYGPGRGTLMKDALRAMKIAPEFLTGLEVVLVESSPALTAIQKEALRESDVEIRWLQQFDTSLADHPLFLLANEFFDALPIHQYVRTARGWCERMVTVDSGGGLAFVLSPVPVPDMAIPANRSGTPEGSVYESSGAGVALAEDIARAIARQGGGALIVDYGYDRPGFGETLQAVAGHSFAEVLGNPGEHDLSAHVDFLALAAAAVREGAAAFRPVTQGDFLRDLGAVQRIEQLAMRHPERAADLQSRLDRLISPEQMGALFKVLAIVPKTAPKPPGF